MGSITAILLTPVVFPSSPHSPLYAGTQLSPMPQRQMLQNPTLPVLLVTHVS